MKKKAAKKYKLKISGEEFEIKATPEAWKKIGGVPVGICTPEYLQSIGEDLIQGYWSIPRKPKKELRHRNIKVIAALLFSVLKHFKSIDDVTPAPFAKATEKDPLLATLKIVRSAFIPWTESISNNQKSFRVTYIVEGKQILEADRDSAIKLILVAESMLPSMWETSRLPETRKLTINMIRHIIYAVRGYKNSVGKPFSYVDDFKTTEAIHSALKRQYPLIVLS